MAYSRLSDWARKAAGLVRAPLRRRDVVLEGVRLGTLEIVPPLDLVAALRADVDVLAHPAWVPAKPRGRPALHAAGDALRGVGAGWAVHARTDRRARQYA